ncbi:MAG: hypothetical protein KY410_06535 [Proteobacteria bacterium]|nr:hypothetical protein [Pseudomonadota bacterium]
MTQFLPISAAVVMMLAGVLLLQYAWRERRAGRRQRRRVVVVVAWLVLALSLAPWTFVAGIDKGAAFAVILFMLAGSALVLRAGLLHSTNRNGREREPRANRNGNGGSGNGDGARSRMVRRAWVFLLAGPLSGVASIAASAGLFAAWNTETGSAANRLACVMLLVPVAWALLATWATYDVSLRARSSIVLGLLLASLTLTYVAMPEVT